MNVGLIPAQDTSTHKDYTYLAQHRIRIMLEQFQLAEKHARRPRLRRWISRPARYFKGLGISRIVYPLTSREIPSSTRMFTGDELVIPLPAGLDIYLTGVKSHDSELRLARYLIRTLTSGQTVFDIGAHLGYFTVLMARCVGDEGIVAAFEPSVNMVDVLQANTAHLPQVRIVHNAVGIAGTRVVFHEYATKYSEYNSYRPTEKVPTLAKREMITIGLDVWCAEQGIFPELIKVDVEGAELDVINGASELLSERQPVLILELRKENFSVLYAPISERLHRHGYVAHRITARGDTEAINNIAVHLKASGLESDNIVFVAS